MTDYTHLSDEQLVQLLAAALDAGDPVPPVVVALAKAAPALVGIDAELAELVHDSMAELAGVRGTGSGRQLDFVAADSELVVVLTETDDGTDLTGQLVPAAEVPVELLRLDEVVRTVEADALGRFRIGDLPSGQLRLRVTGVRLLTPAFEV